MQEKILEDFSCLKLRVGEELVMVLRDNCVCICVSTVGVMGCECLYLKLSNKFNLGIQPMEDIFASSWTFTTFLVLGSFNQYVLRAGSESSCPP